MKLLLLATYCSYALGAVLHKSKSSGGFTPTKLSVAAGTAFPTSDFASYYSPYGAGQTSQEPQPVITDVVYRYSVNPTKSQSDAVVTATITTTYALNLTDPTAIPTVDNADPYVYPIPKSGNGKNTSDVVASTLAKLQAINSNGTAASNCTKCQQGLSVLQGVANTYPSYVPQIMVQACQMFGYGTAESCAATYAATSFGPYITQVIAVMDTMGVDGSNFCFYNGPKVGECPAPVATSLDLSKWFAKPKPSKMPKVKRSGKTTNVLHLSDWHLDPRFKVGAEAKCSQYLCCRPISTNTMANGSIVLPASRFGNLQCDTPIDLGESLFTTLPDLVDLSTFGFAIFTGDLVSHDENNALSRAYVEYTEQITYTLFRKKLGGIPLFPALGNHDSYPEAVEAPHAIQPAGQFDWNYRHLTSLWETNGWLKQDVANAATLTYGAYSTKVPGMKNLRIITINTDHWYHSNYYNFFNMTDPDVSKTLRFLTDELQKAEDAKERVWIVGHVLSGYDGGDALPAPANLFYQIVDRYSYSISGIFWGHTHQDQFMIYYANNATDLSAKTAQNVGWIGPSVTPLTGLNAGWRFYEVDTGSYEIMNAHTFFANMSNSHAWEASSGPVWEYEYSTRKVYDPNNTWPSTEPLNAQFWHGVTDRMMNDSSLVQTYAKYETKSAVGMAPCNSTCEAAKICYMRSGSSALSHANCKYNDKFA